MLTTKKKSGCSIDRIIESSIPHSLCKPEEWYNKEEIMNKLEELNPLYLVSDQTFYGWIRKYYKGTFKKQGLVTLYQGLYINPVIDGIISFKERYKRR